jgi:hypothetical protein
LSSAESGHGFAAASKWLAQHKYEPPNNPYDCPWQLGLGSSETLFEVLARHPQAAQTFNNLMIGAAEEKEVFTEKSTYDVRARLLDGFAGGVLLVDIGGGVGHDLEKFRKAIGPHDGDLILQDQEAVLANAVVKPPVKTMVHDFFTPQPIHGSLAARSRRFDMMRAR